MLQRFRSPVLLEGEAGARPLPAFGAGVGPAGEGIGSARVAWEGRQFDGFPLLFTVGHHQPSSSALYPIPASHSWAWIAGTPLLMSARIARSEEHTSELQSRPHLVCRLLLEKKK